MATLTVSIHLDRAELPSPDELAKRLRIHSRAQLLLSDANAVHFSISLGDGNTLHSLLPCVLDALDDDEQTIIAPFQGGWLLSELGTYFAAAHALSMLVRYHPTRWSRLLNHEKGDTVLPVLERLRSIIQTDFVRLVLWQLERPAIHGAAT